MNFSRIILRSVKKASQYEKSLCIDYVSDSRRKVQNAHYFPCFKLYYFATAAENIGQNLLKNLHQGSVASVHPEMHHCHSESFGRLRINSAKNLPEIVKFLLSHSENPV